MSNTKTFEVFEEFERTLYTQLTTGEPVVLVKEKRERGLRFVLENVAAPGLPALYLDHSCTPPFPFTEEELMSLLAKFAIEERFPKPKVDKK